MKRYKEGSITVFLSLILLLVLALIMTTIETARVNAANALSLRALLTGLHSVMAEYYKPLYEEYHVFGLDAGYGLKEINQDEVNKKIISYMEYTFKPDKNLTEDSINGTYLKLYGMQNILEESNLSDLQNLNNIQNLYNVQIEGIALEKLTSLLDYHGGLFEKQALEYMKYKVPADTVTDFFHNASVMEDSKKLVEILEEKEKTEEQARQLDEVILKLMEKVDGITITQKGIKMKADQVAVNEHFIKKFQKLPVSMNSSGINNEWVFGSLKSHYRDVTGEVGGIINYVDMLEGLNISIDNIHNEIMSLHQIDTSNMNREDKKAYEEQIEEAKNQLNNLIKEKNNLVGEINSKVQSIRGQINGVLTVTQEAISILSNGQSIQKGITKEIEAYENLIESNQGKIGEEFYNGLKEGVEILAGYKGTIINDSSANNEPLKYNNYDFTFMKQQLEENELILNAVSNILSISLNTSNNSFMEFINALRNFQTKMQQYNTNNLNFDYSTLTQPADSQPFFHKIKDLIQNGITGLVVEDSNSISHKALEMESLPSDLVVKESSIVNDTKELLESIDLENGSGLLNNLLFNNSTQTAVDFGEEGLNLVLYQEYLYDHFGYFSSEQKEEKALNYELEYILKGNSKDSENFSSVIMQILTIRTVLNLITLLSDGTKASEAKLLAASFVGFTGMPLLVEAVKMIILTLWALVESLVDITALLKDRAVPLFKTGKEIQTRLIEIIGVNKSLIHNKALNFKELKTSLTLKYKDYLGLFLFFEQKEKKLYRTMDLIQENLQRNYGDAFYMKNCLTGLNVTGTFKMDAKFVNIPFVNNYLREDAGGYQYKFTREYTY